MVLNDKILERKIRAIIQTIDQDGGCTWIEALGLLEHIKLKIDRMAAAGKVVPTDAKKEYSDLKARRVAGMNR